MKKAKITSIILLSIMLVGCGKNAVDSTASTSTSSIEATELVSESLTTEITQTETDEETEVKNVIGDINVKDNGDTIVVNVPKDLVSVENQGEADKKVAEDNGIEEYIVNSDGSATVTYKREAYKERLENLKNEFNSEMEKICSKYSTIEKIECDNDMKNITVYVTNEKDYSDSLDFLGLLSVHLYCGSYQVLTGKYDEIKTYYSLIDSTTGKEFKTNVLPDDFANKVDSTN